jgi:hypothetical protein
MEMSLTAPPISPDEVAGKPSSTFARSTGRRHDDLELHLLNVSGRAESQPTRAPLDVGRQFVRASVSSFRASTITHRPITTRESRTPRPQSMMTPAGPTVLFPGPRPDPLVCIAVSCAFVWIVRVDASTIARWNRDDIADAHQQRLRLRPTRCAASRQIGATTRARTASSILRRLRIIARRHSPPREHGDVIAGVDDGEGAMSRTRSAAMPRFANWSARTSQKVCVLLVAWVISPRRVPFGGRMSTRRSASKG